MKDIAIVDPYPRTMKLIFTKSKSLRLYISGIRTKNPPAGEGTPSKKLSFQDGSSPEFTLNLASLKATQTT